MNRARSVLQAISRLFSWLAGAAILLLMLLVVLEVILRDGFGSTVGGTIEISEVLLAFLVFLGVAYAQQDGSHVNTDLVTSRLPPRAAGAVRAAGMLVAVVVLLTATWATADRAWASMQAGEARFGIRSVPVWPARLIVPVGLLLLALESLLTAWDEWSRPRNEQTKEDTTDREARPEVTA